MIKRILLLILPLTALLSGCTTDFDPKFNSTPVVVINAMIMDGEQVQATVTRSWASGAEKPDVQLPEAAVTVQVNDNLPVLMTYDREKRVFLSDIVASAGDRILIRAADPKYGTAEGSSVVPKAVKIENVTRNVTEEINLNNFTIDGNGNLTYFKMLRVEYTISFSDPGDEENYYMLGGRMECDDPILNENYSALDEIFTSGKGFHVFSDRQINGKTYTLTFKKYYPLAYLPLDEYLVNTITLYSISKEFYNYSLSLFKKYDGFNGSLDEIGLGEPYSVYTNVSSGAGIVASGAAERVVDSLIEVMKPYFPGIDWDNWPGIPVDAEEDADTQLFPNLILEQTAENMGH